MLLNLSRKTYLLTLFVSLSGLLPFLLLAFFAQPLNDDFLNGYLFRNLGMAGFQQHIYQTLTGRFSSTLYVACLNPLNFNDWVLGPKIHAAAFLVILFLSLNFLLYVLLNRSRKFLFFFPLTSLLLTCFIQGMEKVVEFFYWFTGIAVYGVGLYVFLLHLALLILYFNPATRSRNWLLSGIALSGAFLIGANEIIASQTLLLHFIILVWLYSQKQKTHFNRFGVLFLLLLALTLFSLLAPGNYVRANALHGNYPVLLSPDHLLQSLLAALHLLIIKLKAWFTTLGLLATSLLFILLMWKTEAKNLLVIRSGKTILLYLVLAGAALLGQFFICYVTFNYVPGRVLSVTWFLFLLYWWVGLYLVVPYIKYCLQVKVLMDSRHQVMLIRLLFAFIIVTGLFSFQVSTAYKDLFFHAAPYYQANQKRFAYFLQAKEKGIKNLEAPPLLTPPLKYPTTLFMEELKNCPEAGLNLVYSFYFGFNTIQLK